MSRLHEHDWGHSFPLTFPVADTKSRKLVGVAGFEPATPSSRTREGTRVSFERRRFSCDLPSFVLVKSAHTWGIRGGSQIRSRCSPFGWLAPPHRRETIEIEESLRFRRGCQRRDARWPRLVTPKPRRTVVPEALLPAPDHCLGLASRLHDLGSAPAIGRQKNDLRSPDVLLRAVAVRHHRFKLAPVGSAQSDIPSLVHSLSSHARVRQGIPKRIEMSDLVH
jgi:hypothetical protein